MNKLSPNTIALTLVLCGSVPQVHGMAAPLQAELSCANTDPLLGEPVVLTLTVTNTGKEKVQLRDVRLEGVEPDIVTEISRGGGPFTPCRVGLWEPRPVRRSTLTLAPGGSRKYPLKVLVSASEPNALALGSPGEYAIRAAFPVLPPSTPAGSGKRTEIRSNPVSVSVHTPTGVDRQVWAVVSQPLFLAFLHSGRPKRRKTVGEAFLLLDEFPTSAYYPHIREALKEFWELAPDHFSPEERHQLELLGIGVPEVLFPDDSRLNIQVTYDFDQLTELGEIVAELSRRSSVPLAAARDVTGRRMSIGGAHPLRYAMLYLQSTDREWVRRGNGYELRLRKAEPQSER